MLSAVRLQTFCAAIAALIVAAVSMGATPQFALRDVAGVEHRQTEWENKRAIVIFFTTIDCPLSNGYIPEMNRIQKEYTARNVAFYAVEADTTIADRDVRKHAVEFGITFPTLIDKRQTLVRLAGATATPEVAVLSSNGKVLYLGRIDNRVEDFNQHRNIVTEHNLRDTLDAILAGRPVPHAATQVVGCAINVAPEIGKP